MAKRRKPLKIDDIVDTNSGITVPIFLSISGNAFQAELPNGQTIGDQVRTELDKKVMEWLKENTVLEWLPVIKVGEFEGRNGDEFNGVGFWIDRFYYAKKKTSDSYLYKNWEKAIGGQERAWDLRLKNPSKFKPPYQEWGYSGMDFYLPYSEEMWNLLNALQERLGWFKANLRGLLALGEPESFTRLVEDMDKIAPKPVEKRARF